MQEVVVLLGAGSIGQAIARRVSAGRHVLIADLRPDAAESAAQIFRDAGFTVTVAQVNVSSRPSVEALATQAAALGSVMGVIHAAGVSPSRRRSLPSSRLTSMVRRWCSKHLGR